MDARLQKRYLHLVNGHLTVVQAVAAGVKALPGAGTSFAATQAAWRFFANSRVSLPKLVEPLRHLGQEAVAASPSAYVLIVHDWSKLDYDGHSSKTDLIRLSNALDWGYELTTVLLVDAEDGVPLAPMGLALQAADGVHTSEHDAPQGPRPHLEQVLPWMEASRNWGLARTPVHVIDREADSVKHLRRWSAAGHRVVVRADDRRVRHEGQSRKLSDIVRSLQEQGQFTCTRVVEIRGKKGQQHVAETSVTLDGAAWARRSNGKKCRVPGPALPLRLVVAQVRDNQGAVMAEWLLLTNVADVSAERIALWYYWRWQIESFHKLLKSSGLELEEWQQESAAAVAKRLLVACMACVTAWQLQRQTTPAARECQRVLIRLSGRQTKRSRPVTTSALLAGLNKLLTLLDLLEQYTPAQLRCLAEIAAPHLIRVDSG
jgi:Transposase DDE domain